MKGPVAVRKDWISGFVAQCLVHCNERVNHFHSRRNIGAVFVFHCKCSGHFVRAAWGVGRGAWLGFSVRI